MRTIVAGNGKARGGALHYKDFRMLTKSEVYKAGSFPLDFKSKDPLYMVGMSVPPLMIKKIALEIYNQWLSKL